VQKDSKLAGSLYSGITRGHYTGPHILRDSLGIPRNPRDSLRTFPLILQGLCKDSEDFVGTL
jgi:hypothetical protein